MADINHIQLAYSTDIFTFLINLFIIKWSAYNNKTIDSFLNYFRTEWVESRNKGWYEGICNRVPSSNNGLESNNGKIKLNHTFRERIPFNQYLTKCMKMTKRWSEDRDKGVSKFYEELEFKEKLWSLSYQYLLKKPTICKIVGYISSYLITEKIELIDKMQQFNKDIDALNLSFNSAVHLMKIVLLFVSMSHHGLIALLHVIFTSRSICVFIL